MKKSLVFMIAVLLVGALMISCNSEVAGNAAGDGKVVTVGVNLDNSSKALQTSVTNDTNVANLYWYYTATKTDSSLFITGQTSGLTPIDADSTVEGYQKGLQGAVLGDFSTGGWKFSFYGYAANGGETFDVSSTPTGNPVYKCENLEVTITENTNLNVTIEAGEGMANAKLLFNNPTWTYSLAPEGTSLTLKVNDGTSQIATDTASTASNGTATFSQLPNNLTLSAGSHTLTFNVFYGSEQVGQATLSVVAKNGTTITVSGSIENLDSLYTVTVATVTNTVAVSDEISSGEVTEVTAAVTPASASAVTQQEVTNTKVTFAAGVLASVDTTSVQNQKTVTSSVLTMDVSSLADANTGFTVESGSAVAAIDLNLTKTTRIYDITNDTEVLKSETATNVPTFTEFVTVETYIAKGLSEVYVLYNGYVESIAGKEHAIASEDVGHQTDGKADMFDANANPIGAHLGYDKATGLLRFKTKHFSEFYVKCADEAYNATLGKAYATAKEACNYVGNNQVIMLLKDVSNSDKIIFKNVNGVTFNLNGKTLHLANEKCIDINHSVVSITGNGTIQVCPKAKGSAIYVSNNSTLNFKNGSLNVSNEAKKAFGIFMYNQEFVNLGNSEDYTGPSFNVTGPCLATNGSCDGGTFNVYGGTYTSTRDTGDGDSNVIQIANQSAYTNTLNIYGGTFNQTTTPNDNLANIIELRYAGLKVINIQGGMFNSTAKTINSWQTGREDGKANNVQLTVAEGITISKDW